MKKIAIAIIAGLIFWSCDTPIQLDLKQTDSKIVIEGLVTNRPDKQYVKLSRTGSFYGDGKTTRITNAVVSVKDDLDRVYEFKHDATAAGYYFPQPSFVGEIGRTYSLVVEVDGQTYTAEDKMYSVIPIDTLKYRINKNQQEKPKEKNKIYELLFYGTEPQETKDYYLFKFYRNDSIKFDKHNDVYFSDDELLGENIDGLASPNYYGVGDSARVELYSLTRNGFVFYSDLQSLLNNDGGLFGSPPANCRTNLTNGAVGFFQVSALNAKALRITE